MCGVQMYAVRAHGCLIQIMYVCTAVMPKGLDFALREALSCVAGRFRLR